MNRCLKWGFTLVLVLWICGFNVSLASGMGDDGAAVEKPMGSRPGAVGGKSFTNSLRMTFVYIAPGSFAMGSPSTNLTVTATRNRMG